MLKDIKNSDTDSLDATGGTSQRISGIFGVLIAPKVLVQKKL